MNMLKLAMSPVGMMHNWNKVLHGTMMSRIWGVLIDYLGSRNCFEEWMFLLYQNAIYYHAVIRRTQHTTPT